MKEQFISKLICTPWHIAAARGRNIIAGMAMTLMKNERPAEDVFGDPLPTMSIEGDMALIPVNGVLMCNVPDWVKQWGFNVTDVNDIAEELDEAVADPNVTFITMPVDSPGGESVAGEKLYDAVEQAQKKKPVFVYTMDGALLCSSAFQGAAPSVAILTGKFATVGCIGTYLVNLDDSKYWENLGVTFEVFRSGSLKAIGQEGKLNDEQRSYLQSTVDAFGARFRKGVSKYRTGIDPADMQGQDFLGSEAASRGFTAGTVKDLNGAISKFRKMI